LSVAGCTTAQAHHEMVKRERIVPPLPNDNGWIDEALRPPPKPESSSIPSYQHS
jgi:hypothetical protein